MAETPSTPPSPLEPGPRHPIVSNNRIQNIPHPPLTGSDPPGLSARALRLAHLLFGAALLAAIYSSRALWADGAYFLLRVLETRDFATMWPTRASANVLMELPLLLGLKAGLTNLTVLRLLFGFGCFCVWPLAMWLCHRMAPQHYWLVVVACAAGYCNAAFMAIGEHIVAHAFFWTALCALLFVRPLTRLAGVTLILSGLVLTAAYESLLFLGPLLAGLALWRAGDRRESGWARVTCLLAAGLFAFDVGISFLGVRYFPPQQKSAFIAGLLDNLAHPVWTVVWSLAVCALAAAGCFSASLRARLLQPRSLRAAVAALVLWGAWPLLAPGHIRPEMQYSSRFLDLLVPFALFFVALAVLRWPRWFEFRRQWLVLCAAVLLLGQSFWHFSATWQWHGYINTLRGVLASSEGPVYQSDTLFRSNRAQDQSFEFNWFWTGPAMSVILSPDGEVKSMIMTRLGRRWQWMHPSFDPLRPSALPHLERYGIHYDAYLAALPRRPEKTRAPVSLSPARAR